MKRYAVFVDGEKQTELFAPSASDACEWYSRRKNKEPSTVTAEEIKDAPIPDDSKE